MEAATSITPIRPPRLPEFDDSSLYRKYRVRICLRERIDGGIPKDKELIDAWIKAKTGFDDDLARAIAAQTKEEFEQITTEKAEGMWTGFKTLNGEPYIECRQVKALLRESAQMMSVIAKQRGSRQVLQHGFEVRGVDGGLKIMLENYGKLKTEDKAIHVKTAQGPRNALKRTDYAVEGTELEFQIWILNTQPNETRTISTENLRQMLIFAQNDGLGANRSQDSGKFDVIAFEELAKPAEYVGAGLGKKEGEAKPRGKK